MAGKAFVKLTDRRDRRVAIGGFEGGGRGARAASAVALGVGRDARVAGLGRAGRGAAAGRGAEARRRGADAARWRRRPGARSRRPTGFAPFCRARLENGDARGGSGRVGARARARGRAGRARGEARGGGTPWRTTTGGAAGARVGVKARARRRGGRSMVIKAAAPGGPAQSWLIFYFSDEGRLDARCQLIVCSRRRRQRTAHSLADPPVRLTSRLRSRTRPPPSALAMPLRA